MMEGDNETTPVLDKLIEINNRGPSVQLQKMNPLVAKGFNIPPKS